MRVEWSFSIFIQNDATPSMLKQLLSFRTSSSISCNNSDEGSKPNKFSDGVIDDALIRQANALFKKGEKSYAKKNYESSKQHFHEALRSRLLLFGADSIHVTECHRKLMEIASLEKDMAKTEYHLKAIRRARSNSASSCQWLRFCCQELRLRSPTETRSHLTANPRFLVNYSLLGCESIAMDCDDNNSNKKVNPWIISFFRPTLMCVQVLKASKSF